MIIEKICCRCKVKKEHQDFSFCSHSKDKLSYACKSCNNAANKGQRNKKRLNKLKTTTQNIIKDLDNEIWKDIPEYEGYYQISNMGRIKSLRRSDDNYTKFTDSILRPQKDCDNYYHIKLCKDGVVEDRTIHTLVSESFIPNPNNFPVTHHINHNCQDNRAENLMWATYKQNSDFANEAGRLKKKYKNPNSPKAIKIKETVPSYYIDENFSPNDEVWVNMVGFESKYKISNYGRVLSLARKQCKKNRFLKPKLTPCRTNKSPLSFFLSGGERLANGRRYKVITAHRLVAIHFLKNPNNLPEIDHIDTNKLNNHASNLEWVKHKENSIRAAKNGLIRRGEKSHHAKLTEKQVVEIRNSHELLKTSYRQLGKIYNVRPNTIAALILRKTWKHLT